MATETIEKRQETADGGTFARLCVRGMRKVCRAQLEKILDVQRRSDTTFPDSRRALHMHVLERDFGIRVACMQHDCANMCKYAERCGDRGPVTIPGHALKLRFPPSPRHVELYAVHVLASGLLSWKWTFSSARFQLRSRRECGMEVYLSTLPCWEGLELCQYIEKLWQRLSQ